MGTKLKQEIAIRNNCFHLNTSVLHICYTVLNNKWSFGKIVTLLQLSNISSASSSSVIRKYIRNMKETFGSYSTQKYSKQNLAIHKTLCLPLNINNTRFSVLI